MFELTYRPPPRDLIDFVSAFYLFEADEVAIDDLERADVAQLRFVIAGSGDILFPDGRAEAFHPASLCGPRLTASRVRARGPVRMFGCGLQPAGWIALTHADASTYANRIADAEAVLGDGMAACRAAVAAAPDIDAMADIVAAHLRACVAAAQGLPIGLIRVVDGWLESSISPEIADLVAQTGLSQRQTEKLVKQVYGAPPKLLARKYRALRTANAIAHGDGSWQDYAADYYYDHSHCIRDIKAFIGITPAAICKARSRLSQLTFGRRQLEGSIAPLSAAS